MAAALSPLGPPLQYKTIPKRYVQAIRHYAEPQEARLGWQLYVLAPAPPSGAQLGKDAITAD